MHCPVRPEACGGGREDRRSPEIPRLFCCAALHRPNISTLGFGLRNGRGGVEGFSKEKQILVIQRRKRRRLGMLFGKTGPKN